MNKISPGEKIPLMYSQMNGQKITLERPALTIDGRKRQGAYDPIPTDGVVTQFQKAAKSSLTCSRSKWVTWVRGKLPILTWLVGYDVNNWLLGDAVAGVTVAIMHIPQGMGFALLANVPAICGIYMAFFQSFVYAILGTSQHNSMGSFAVITLMTGKVVKELATFPSATGMMTSPGGGNMTEALLVAGSEDVIMNVTEYTPIQVATVVTFMVGVWHMLFGLLQLGSLAVFLSDMLVSGFTTAAAVHVLTSQMKDMLGISVQSYSGPLKIIYTYVDIFSQVSSANIATIVITGVTLCALIINNEVLKPIVARYSKVPVPIELLAVIIGTATSYLANFTDIYDVQIIGNVPTGLPPPETPPLELAGRVAVDSLVIAIVSYTVNFSLAKIFAAKHGYPVDATQELYATGVGNLFSSFFSCPPMASALARALIQDAVGGVTQMASLIVCAILLLVLLFVGPVFEALPKAVLASIIIVALKGMFMQVKDAYHRWSVARIEAVTWLVTFLSVVIIDIDIGLLIGVLFSLCVLLNGSQRPRVLTLGRVEGTDLYLEGEAYSQAKPVAGLCLVKIQGSIHFANWENLRRALMKAWGRADPKDAVARKKKEAKKEVEERKEEGETQSQANKETLMQALENGGANLEAFGIPTSTLILDMSGVSAIDSTGAKFLSQLRKEFQAADVTLCLAGISESVLGMLEATGCEKDFDAQQHLFHSLHDAVVIATAGNHK